MGSNGNTEGPINSVLELIGRTPMVILKRISRKIPAEIWAKLEYLSGRASGHHKIHGIGEGFISKVIQDLADEIVVVSVTIIADSGLRYLSTELFQ